MAVDPSLQEAARAAYEAAGTQKALAQELDVSPRMVRHMLAGTKGRNRLPQLRAIAAGQEPPREDVARRQGVRQPVQTVGGTRQYESQAKQSADRLELNATARREVDRAARAGKRVSLRFEYRTPSGETRTGTLYKRGGHRAAAVGRALDGGLTLGDLVDDQGTSDPPPAGSTVTSVTVTTF